MKNLLPIIIVLLLASTSFICVSYSVEKSSTVSFNGDTLYVGGSGPNNYTKIQDAIDNASDGDTVFVYDNSSPYCENLIVKKSINLIGEDRNTTVVDGNWNEVYVLRITSDHVEVSGFTMTHSGNAVEMRSSYSNIVGNNINNNVGTGIYLYKSHDTHILNNYINNNYQGIYLDGSSENIIVENEIKNNTNDGIRFDNSTSNNISGNVISKNTYNIFFHFFSGNNIIRNNVISDSSQRGILIMYGSDDNTICGNIFTNNIWYGLQIETNSNKLYHNNFIGNKFHAAFIRITLVTSIINFNKWDGNYWDNWIGLEHPLLSKFPKIIYGGLSRTLSLIPCFSFDRHPAKEPYDI